MSPVTLGLSSEAAGRSPQPHFDALTPLSFLERSARVHAARIAVVDGDTQFTYAQWNRRAQGFAGYLRSLGIGSGDRVAVIASNSEPMLLAHFAIPMVGADLVALNTRLGPREVDYIIEHSGAKVAFVSPALTTSLADRPGVQRIVLDMVLCDGFEHHIDSYAGWQVSDERDSIAVNYTSGTTGKAKGVIYHHRGAYLNALAMALDHGLNAESTYLWTLPMFHCNGWCFPWATIAVGARNFCLERIDPKQIWELCASGEVTHLCAAPTVLTMLAESEFATTIEGPVRVITAGAPPAPTIIERIESFGFVVDHVYGLTETYGPFTVNVSSPDLDASEATDRYRVRARQGFANVTAGLVEVRTEDGRRVPADGQTLGEVRMRGNVVMTGYLDDEAATHEAFRDGWFHSGDIGVVHPDGQIELRDRKKDLIISGGENISTVEVEQVVVEHHDVVECAVVAQPDERWGEVPLAFVTLRPGVSVTESDLRDHCRERLAHFKCPARFVFTDLPKTATGKIVKTQLRDQARDLVVGAQVKTVDQSQR
ncbi:MAG: AMP-binding protein [Ornithinimicrobium sp.]